MDPAPAPAPPAKLTDAEVDAVLGLTDAPAAAAAFVCPRCKGQRVRVTTRQTRSADEGPTAFFKCQTCKKAWSQRS